MRARAESLEPLPGIPSARETRSPCKQGLTRSNSGHYGLNYKEGQKFCGSILGIERRSWQRKAKNRVATEMKQSLSLTTDRYDIQRLPTHLSHTARAGWGFGSLNLSFLFGLS